ncbi:hypothetical protein FDP41_011441 [Naegleria fowleri]|uniref:Mitogen-activated protein kinase n=1 Tax=Naegleria fowleri TaxID=5763 RepID=A0A6A5C606_NAEFO|nr:uncharacterized protein FDP41_011441 [Naegleria fowleri]KAF0982511.1 hypothetical protein FDP41_011441 [Naegleria fowleri]CAG4707684.1 unnamed protein product [Naegleria fowleri]
MSQSNHPLLSSSSISHQQQQQHRKKVYTVDGTVFEVDDHYSIIKPIGYGAYGFVCSGIDKNTNEKVAIKKVPKVFQDLVDGKRILREIELLKTFRHANIISVKDVMTIPDKSTFNDVYIVNELMDTDLYQVIKSKQELSTEHIQYFVYQILRGLKYIHSSNVLHRDLKPSNILVNENCDVKICDLGLARGFDDHSEMTEYVVTRWYRAPELVLMCKEYNYAIDIWSVGCILAELIERRPIFPGKDYIDQINLITDALGTPLEEDMEHVKHSEARRYIRNLPKKKPIPFKQLFPKAKKDELDILSKMLVFNPKKRISAEEALAHPYFSSLHDPKDEPSSNISFSFKYENVDITEPELRDSLYALACYYHPEMLQQQQRK